MTIAKKLSMTNKGLRYKLMIAFSLMAVIPLLACAYLLCPSLFPGFRNFADISTVIFVSIAISILGLIIARKIIDSVIKLSSETRVIANGDYDRYVKVWGDDELGNLGRSINTMTQKIRSNLDELKNYDLNMKEISVEIQKKVMALSNLLQMGEIISAGSIQIDSFLEFAVDKAANLFKTGFGALYMPRDEDGDFIAKVCYNAGKERLADIVIRKAGRGILERAIENKIMLQVTDGMSLGKDMEDFKKAYNLKNFLAVPICSDRVTFGLLLLGNRLSDFNYVDDDINLAAVFAKHITIAIESAMLEKKSKELATKDDLTGLFNKRYVLIRLEEEIKRAIFYQRPCSFVVFGVDNFESFRGANGELIAEEALKRIAKVIKENNVPVGMAARISGDEFAMLLPERNKKEASGIAEDVRKKIGIANVLKEGKATLTVSAGVSENPIDGTTSDELLRKAMASLERAKALGKNRIAA